MTNNLKTSKDMDVIRWIASNDNDKLSVVCRILLSVVEMMAGNTAIAGGATKPTVKLGRKRLTNHDRKEIVESVEKPTNLMKQYGVAFGTLRSIKSGTRSYSAFGGSKENWFLYKGRHAVDCIRLSGEEGSSARRHPYSKDERILDIITSCEPPAALIHRYQCSMEHVRTVKRGFGRYGDKGGSEANWRGYYDQHRSEIENFLRIQR